MVTTTELLSLTLGHNAGGSDAKKKTKTKVVLKKKVKI